MLSILRRPACLVAALTPLLALPLFADELEDLTAKAAKGDAAAQFALGQRYATGQGVAKDDARALEWYRKAAERDHAKAQVSLGAIYSHGFGVPVDWAESIRWFRKAAGQGDRVAQHNLGLDYNFGHGVQRDYAEAARWYRLGAEQGQARCQFNLALLYEAGQGVPPSKLEAFIFHSLAAAHSDQEKIFGEAKAKEVVERRDRLAQGLTPTELKDAARRIAAFQALVEVHPRRFGAPGTGVGPSRNWYIWQRYDPATGAAEVSNDPPTETIKIRVLPWVTTYRYLNYGVRPERLLPGERVNLFLSADENHRRGYLVHFQDEICQMKGHGHTWQVRQAGDDKFTARVMAGDKPLDGQEREFVLDGQCQFWQGGKRTSKRAVAENERLFLTWCWREGKRVVVLLSDDASLDAIKREEGERLAKEIATEGIAGRLESLDGETLHLLVFPNYWPQTGRLKPNQRLLLSPTGKDPIEATVTFAKNRGQYGSGVTDVLLKLRADDVAPARRWLDEKVIRAVIRAE